MNIGYFLIAGSIGYILGSIPFGYLYVKTKTGKDIRTIGSGRMGGTNSYRAGGVAIGLLTAVSDFLKGAVSVWVAGWLFADKVDPRNVDLDCHHWRRDGCYGPQLVNFPEIQRGCWHWPERGLVIWSFGCPCCRLPSLLCSVYFG